MMPIEELLSKGKIPDGVLFFVCLIVVFNASSVERTGNTFRIESEEHPEEKKIISKMTVYR